MAEIWIPDKDLAKKYTCYKSLANFHFSGFSISLGDCVYVDHRIRNLPRFLEIDRIAHPLPASTKRYVRDRKTSRGHWEDKVPKGEELS